MQEYVTTDSIICYSSDIITCSVISWKLHCTLEDSVQSFLQKGFDLEDPQQETWGPEYPLRTNALESSPAASIF